MTKTEGDEGAGRREEIRERAAAPASQGARGGPPRGRWAPTPSGLLHLGSARTALVTWLSIRRAGGTLVWRLEDLDPPRVMPGAAQAALEDVAWLSLDWDEGRRFEGGESGPFGPYDQGRRGPFYEAALRRLAGAGRLFPCHLSRRDLRQLATAPHGPAAGPAYPDSQRPRELAAGWLEAAMAGEGPKGEGAALRFRVTSDEVVFRDLVQGERRERVDRTVGHFVLRRRDGLVAYQLAVVVDDLAMEIDEVVRGEDLLDSTARQIQLTEALDGRRLTYAHVPLVLNHRGEKISKRDGGLTLRALREAGVRPEQVVGYLAASLGLLEEPRAVHPRDLIPKFAWHRLPTRPFVLPEDPAPVLGAVD